MDYVDQVFTDQLIDLDGNSFERCTFEGCILQYGGGKLSLTDPLLVDRNRLQFINGVDPDDNPVINFFKAGVAANGGRILPEGERPDKQPITPKKDMG